MNYVRQRVFMYCKILSLSNCPQFMVQHFFEFIELIYTYLYIRKAVTNYIIYILLSNSLTATRFKHFRYSELRLKQSYN